MTREPAPSALASPRSRSCSLPPHWDVLGRFRARSFAFALGLAIALTGPTGEMPSAVAGSPPTLVIDRLDLVPEAKAYERFVRRALRREAASRDWGAQSGSTIEYRFSVAKLLVTRKDDVLTVQCSASGRLPRGRTARSQLTFSGDPKHERRLIERVLTIVVQGVLTRLSDIERERREQD